VLLFAGLAEAVGKRELCVPDGGPAAAGGELPRSVGELEARLRAEQPALAGRAFRVAVNRRYAAGDAAVAPGDEIALIPPVSGG
jgi:molybdopterin converting factor small subunit